MGVVRPDDPVGGVGLEADEAEQHLVDAALDRPEAELVGGCLDGSADGPVTHLLECARRAAERDRDLGIREDELVDRRVVGGGEETKPETVGLQRQDGHEALLSEEWRPRALDRRGQNYATTSTGA